MQAFVLKTKNSSYLVEITDQDVGLAKIASHEQGGISLTVPATDWVRGKELILRPSGAMLLGEEGQVFRTSRLDG